jgi:hypothetical protein
MPATTYVSAETLGNLITITSTKDESGVVTKTKVVRTKKQCYSNITGTGTAQVFSIVDHKGSTIFTKTFASGTQASVTHSINEKVTFADIWAEFNTWNGGVGVAALQPERVYIAQLTQTSISAPTYTVIKNTLGSPVAFAYTNTGRYTQAIGTIFDKTKATYSIGGGTAETTTMQVGVTSDNLIVSTMTSQLYANALLSATPVTIRVQH